MKKMAIIGAGYLAKEIAIKAKQLNVYTICFAWDVNAIAKECVDKFVDVSIFETEKILLICKQEKINGVIATTEITVPVCSYIAKELKLNSLDYELSKVVTNKYLNRQKADTVKELKQPKYLKFKELYDLEYGKFSFPLILKPLNLSGKRGVIVVKNSEQITDSYNYVRKFTNDEILAEEYLDSGNEYSVESLSFHGRHYIIQITKKITSGPPHCVELGHIQPADLSLELKGKIVKIINDLLNAIGIDNTATHTEIKIIDNDVYLIELNARAGGDRISHPLIELSTGYSYLEGMIKIALDEFEKVNFSNFLSNESGIRFVTEQTKELKSVFDVIDNYDWCYEKHIAYNSPNEIEVNCSDDVNYYIYCLTNKKDVEEYKRLLGKAYE